jgi:hypothetical protein
MNDLLLNILGGITIAGLIVGFMNIRETIFLGMGICVLTLSALVVVSLSELRHTYTTLSFILELISVLGNVLILLGLIMFYTLYCLFRNKEYIRDGSMPDSWYTFSYFVIGVSGLNILSIIAYMKYNQSYGYKAMSMLLTTILLGFILIEYIICSYFRTDGFAMN